MIDRIVKIFKHEYQYSGFPALYFVGLSESGSLYRLRFDNGNGLRTDEWELLCHSPIIKDLVEIKEEEKTNKELTSMEKDA